MSSYEEIVNTDTGYTSHLPFFKKLFSIMKVENFFECGCGYSTKYFIENCGHVTSVEFVNDGNDAAWMDKCREMYKDLSWTSIIHNATPSIYSACSYRSAEHKDYELIDGAYIQELKDFFNTFKIDVVFVDCGVCIRGDMVELLLRQEVAVVVAHDYGHDNFNISQYGWDKIKTVNNYELVWLDTTAFWIKKELVNVIEGMKKL